MRKNQTTIKDIALKTGLSSATISLILSGKMLERFSDKTIQTVRTVAKELNYNRDIKGKNILVVCPSVFNPYYATVLQGMDMEAAELGFSTLVYNTYWDTDKEKKVLEFVKNPTICGVIFAMIPQQLEVAMELNKTIPVVAIGDYHKDLQLDAVDINNFNAGKLVAQHLLSLGHRHIAYISTTLDIHHSARTQRLAGLQKNFENIAEAYKIHIYSRSVTPAYEINNINVEFETGYELTLECIKKTPEVTAVVAINDMVAYGCINAIRDRGFKIPEDFSVCGFDNIFPSKFYGTELTSVEHHIVQRGKKAVALIAARPQNRNNIFDVIRVEYKSNLVIRSSTSVPRTNNSTELR